MRINWKLISIQKATFDFDFFTSLSQAFCSEGLHVNAPHRAKISRETAESKTLCHMAENTGLSMQGLVKRASPFLNPFLLLFPFLLSSLFPFQRTHSFSLPPLIFSTWANEDDVDANVRNSCLYWKANSPPPHYVTGVRAYSKSLQKRF